MPLTFNSPIDEEIGDMSSDGKHLVDSSLSLEYEYPFWTKGSISLLSNDNTEMSVSEDGEIFR